MAAHDAKGTAIWHHPAFGGAVMGFAAILAIAIENSGYAMLAEGLLESKASISVGKFSFEKSILHWINDALMAVFFLGVGLEIKREFLLGALSSRDKAILPFAGAIGGMVVPGLFYVAVNLASPATLGGWAIPAATDIAFAMAAVAILGTRVPASLKAFLLALAIIDDLGAIIIIAIFYTAELSSVALMLAMVGCAGLVWLNRNRERTLTPYVLLGVFVWVCVLKSGVHATLAGVIVALAIPLIRRDGTENPAFAWLEKSLHPWVTFAILPLFAFANAGVSFAGMSFGTLLDPVPLGIMLGLLLGKPIGIVGVSWLAIRAGIATLPTAATWPLLVGVSALCGIGFTMSLFIGMLAFPGIEYAAGVRLGVLAGSILSGALGMTILIAYGRQLRRRADVAERDAIRTAENQKAIAAEGAAAANAAPGSAQPPKK